MFKSFISGCVEGIIESFKKDSVYASCFTADSKTVLSEFGVLCVTFATISATLGTMHNLPKIVVQELARLSKEDKNA